MYLMYYVSHVLCISVYHRRQGSDLVALAVRDTNLRASQTYQQEDCSGLHIVATCHVMKYIICEVQWWSCLSPHPGKLIAVSTLLY